MIVVKTIFILFSILSVIVCIWAMFSGKNLVSRKNPKKMPEPFGTIHEILDDNLYYQCFIKKYEFFLRLIYGSKIKAEMLATCYSICYPCLCVVFITLTILFVHVWYYALAIMIFGIIIPFLLITINIMSKCQKIRLSLISSYESLERHFSENVPVIKAVQEVEAITHGPIKRLYTNFINDYAADRDVAYENLKMTIDDTYGEGIVDSMKHYDETGESPCESIRNAIVMSNRNYTSLAATHRAYRGFIILAFGIFLMDLFMAGLSSRVSPDSSIQGGVGTTLTYISCILCFYSITEALWHERER